MGCGDFSHPEVHPYAGCGNQASDARDLHDARTWCIELQLGCMGLFSGDEWVCSLGMLKTCKGRGAGRLFDR